MTQYAARFEQLVDISTHTLRKEGDGQLEEHIAELTVFQPTPSARRVTASSISLSYSNLISTHTLRKEGDPYLIT